MKHSIRSRVTALLVLSLPMTAVIAQDNFLLEEIVVTAQKREQNLQEVPIAVTAYTGSMLEESAIKDMRELAAIAPSLVSSQSQTATVSSFSIRGIGTSSQNFGLESSVGIYIDGVYRSRQSSIINNLVDIQSVEVLRGPQGTLFGKNTPSGALNITTVKPSHDQNAFFEATAGDLGLTNLSGAMNFSLVEDVLAMRVTGFSGQRDGYVDVVGLGDDVVNDRDRHGARIQFLYTPTDRLDFRLIADFAEIDEACCAAVTLRNNFFDFNGDPLSDAFLQFSLGVPVINEDRFDDNVMALNFLPRSTSDEDGVSLEINYDIGDATLTSISAVRSFDTTDFIDADFSAARLLTDNNLAEQESFSQEIRLAGTWGESTNWVVGGYYFDQDLRNISTLTTGADTTAFFGNDPTLAAVTNGVNLVSSLSGGALPQAASSFPDGAFVTDDMRQEHESFAVFAQMDFALTDRWILTAGARYTDETKDLFANFENSPIGPPPNLGLIQSTLIGIQTWAANPAAPGALDPTDPANGPAIFGAFSPLYAPGWGYYTLDALAPQASGFDRLEDDQVTGTLKLSFMLNDDVMFYGSYGTGFKSGGTNTDRISPAFSQTFLAETAESYEVGMKADFPDQNLRLNIAYHDTQIEDLQANAFTGTGFNLSNAGNADTNGLEVEATWLPSDTMNVNFSYAWSIADFENFVNGTCWVATPLQTGQPDPGGAPDPNTGELDLNASICDRSGGRVPSNPEHSAYLGIQNDFPLTSTTNLFTNLEYIYMSDTMTDGNNDPLKLRPAFDFVNLRAGIDFDEWNAQVAVWVRNLTDERFYETVFDVPVQDGKLNAYPHEPRTWGVTFRKNFD